MDNARLSRARPRERITLLEMRKIPTFGVGELRKSTLYTPRFAAE